jgi:flagellar motor switch protein FliG
MANMHSKEKAAVLFSMIGEHLPKEVLSELKNEELEKLMDALAKLPKTSKMDERNILNTFNQTISGDKPQKRSPLYIVEKSKNEQKYQSNAPRTSPLNDLKRKTREDLELIIRGEEPKTVARVMCFCDPDAASRIIEEFPEKIRDSIVKEIQNIDFYSESMKSELEAFLFFKYDLIESRSIVTKVKNRSGKTIADLLSRINPHISSKLFFSIKERDPEFAQSVNEHYYTITDLMNIGRTSLSNFLSEFHPIVLACALKGVETDLKENILERCDPWLSKQINIEIDSMGPISYAEIDLAQKAIIENLNKAIDSGKIKLWKV